MVAYKAEWHAADKERLNTVSREYYATHRDEQRAKQAARYQQKHERYRAVNRAAVLRWQKENPEKVRAKARAYQARKRAELHASQ
jgi:hypothetical protein